MNNPTPYSDEYEKPDLLQDGIPRQAMNYWGVDYIGQFCITKYSSFEIKYQQIRFDKENFVIEVKSERKDQDWVPVINNRNIIISQTNDPEKGKYIDYVKSINNPQARHHLVNEYWSVNLSVEKLEKGWPFEC